MYPMVSSEYASACDIVSTLVMAPSLVVELAACAFQDKFQPLAERGARRRYVKPVVVVAAF